MTPMYHNPACYWEKERRPGGKRTNETRVADIFHRDQPGIVVLQLRGDSTEVDAIAAAIAQENSTCLRAKNEDAMQKMQTFIVRLRFMCEGEDSRDLQNIAAWIDRDFPKAREVAMGLQLRGDSTEVDATAADIVRGNTTCRWTEDEDGVYDGACGIRWYFECGDVKENEVNFCPRCGKHVEESDRTGEVGK